MILQYVPDTRRSCAHARTHRRDVRLEPSLKGFALLEQFAQVPLALCVLCLGGLRTLSAPAHQHAKVGRKASHGRSHTSLTRMLAYIELPARASRVSTYLRRCFHSTQSADAHTHTRTQQYESTHTLPGKRKGVHSHTRARAHARTHATDVESRTANCCTAASRSARARVSCCSKATSASVF